MEKIDGEGGVGVDDDDDHGTDDDKVGDDDGDGVDEGDEVSYDRVANMVE
jgi:hypothetical protein